MAATATKAHVKVVDHSARTGQAKTTKSQQPPKLQPCAIVFVLASWFASFVAVSDCQLQLEPPVHSFFFAFPKRFSIFIFILFCFIA